jgi:hypothetical protein
MLDVPSMNDGLCSLPYLDGLTMIRTLLRRSWPGLFAVAWLMGGPDTPARADGPIPIATNSCFYYRCDIKIGPHAFARPAGPWYSYFPMDPYLIAQPRASAFPNWPTQPPPGAAPAPPPGLVPIGTTAYYYPDQSLPYVYAAGAYAPAAYTANYYSPPSTPGYWYAP